MPPPLGMAAEPEDAKRELGEARAKPAAHREPCRAAGRRS